MRESQPTSVQRDVARLQGVGVPIGTRKGPGGGYRIDAPSTLAPVPLTTGEAAALVSALAAFGPYSSATARSALDKLIGALAPR